VLMLHGSPHLSAPNIIGENCAQWGDVRNSVIRVAAAKQISESLIVAGHAGLHDHYPSQLIARCAV